MLGARAYRDTATYWGDPSQDGFGSVTFASPVLLKCRWEDRTETFTTMSGDERVSRAIVWTFNLLEDGGYLCKGDHTAQSDPTQLDEALRIERVDEIPDLRGLNQERKSYL